MALPTNPGQQVLNLRNLAPQEQSQKEVHLSDKVLTNPQMESGDKKENRTTGPGSWGVQIGSRQAKESSLETIHLTGSWPLPLPPAYHGQVSFPQLYNKENTPTSRAVFSYKITRLLAKHLAKGRCQ